MIAPVATTSLYFELETCDRFADDLRQCRFILFPRGNRLSSIQLFETMNAARVPVIISDARVLPDYALVQAKRARRALQNARRPAA